MSAILSKLLGLCVFMLPVLLGANSVQAATLVINGGFGTDDFTGWTNSGNTGSIYVENVGTSILGGSSYYAALEPSDSDGILSQNLSTAPNHSYDLSFSLASSGGMPNDFSVMFGGNSVSFLGSNGSPNLPIVEPGASDFPFTEYSAIVTATGTNSNLEFLYRDDPGFIGLTNVSMTESEISAVPLPPALPMFGAALFALGGLAWRKRKTQS